MADAIVALHNSGSAKPPSERVLRMSDEDIEKAIAEIKAALRRNALG